MASELIEQFINITSPLENVWDVFRRMQIKGKVLLEDPYRTFQIEELLDKGRTTSITTWTFSYLAPDTRVFVAEELRGAFAMNKYPERFELRKIELFELMAEVNQLDGQ